MRRRLLPLVLVSLIGSTKIENQTVNDAAAIARAAAAAAIDAYRMGLDDRER